MVLTVKRPPNSANPEFLTSYVSQSGVDPVYLQPDVENKLGGLIPGASGVFILNGFDSGCLAISQ